MLVPVQWQPVGSNLGDATLLRGQLTEKEIGVRICVLRTLYSRGQNVIEKMIIRYFVLQKARNEKVLNK